MTERPFHFLVKTPEARWANADVDGIPERSRAERFLESGRTASVARTGKRGETSFEREIPSRGVCADCETECAVSIPRFCHGGGIVTGLVELAIHYRRQGFPNVPREASEGLRM
jgi:hypothetical protein